MKTKLTPGLWYDTEATGNNRIQGWFYVKSVTDVIRGKWAWTIKDAMSGELSSWGLDGLNEIEYRCINMSFKLYYGKCKGR